MKKTDAAADQEPQQDPTPEAQAATPASNAPPAFDPAHEWPNEGGCYVRRADGTLTKEG